MFSPVSDQLYPDRYDMVLITSLTILLLTVNSGLSTCCISLLWVATSMGHSSLPSSWPLVGPFLDHYRNSQKL
jgi:hypothetical protein